MASMFYGADAFDKVVTVWNICNVDTGYGFQGMFSASGQPTANLVPNANGECIDCPDGTTSGSGKYVSGQNPCTPV